MHKRRHVSDPALELLEKANLPPVEIDAALEAVVWSSSGAVLRVSHPLLQRIAQASGVNVTEIRRRSRYLLIAIEQFDEQGASWQYREHTPRNCLFSCRGQVADGLAIGLGGELLEKLACPTPALSRSRIIDVSPADDMWLNVRVTPEWRLF
jgi:hypothetical protein